ncbi:MAG TPA: 5'-3' exonuclease H3TH domain-containing protein [Solirubrobacteraceae bacterium]|jgi:DNA polymerase-1|nr:5'-3' exonuclease H3TH domain-containing protein [Solirubrobacteraceae bacterium]
MQSPGPLLTADVPWLLYRAFFALPKSIVGSEQRPVNALLGTVNALLGVIESRAHEQRPRAIVACLGAEQADYRVELYPPYHAHRDPMPAELAWQWQRAGELLASLGWIVAGSETLEADDVMFSFARVEQAAGGRALLMTGDRDLYGAVSERVAVLELGKGGTSTELGPAQVRERYGIEPQFVPDLIALRGDPSDGIPGAPGIGAKTAAELLRRYGSLEDALDAAHALATKVRREDGEMRPRAAVTLREHDALLRDFKRIATLQQIDVQPPPDTPTDFAGGASAARELGMNRLAERLEKLADSAARA